MALRQLAARTASLGLKWQVSSASAGLLPNWMIATSSRAFASDYTVKEGYKYAKSHEWSEAQGDVATVGISDFAQAELGEVVYVELPEVNTEVTAGQPFGVVESVKAASDVYSPVSGTVVETNASALTEEPGKVNTDPYAAGWLIKVKLSNKAEHDALLDHAAYEASLPAKS